MTAPSRTPGDPQFFPVPLSQASPGDRDSPLAAEVQGSLGLALDFSAHSVALLGMAPGVCGWLVLGTLCQAWRSGFGGTCLHGVPPTPGWLQCSGWGQARIAAFRLDPK